MSMSFFPRIQATYVESTDCGPCSSDFSWCLQKVLAGSTAEDKLRGSTQWHADNPVKFSPLWSDQKTHQWVISESEAWPNFIKKLAIDQATVLSNFTIDQATIVLLATMEFRDFNDWWIWSWGERHGIMRLWGTSEGCCWSLGTGILAGHGGWPG